MRAIMEGGLRRKLMKLRWRRRGKAMRKGAEDLTRLPSSAGVAIRDVDFCRGRSAPFHSRMRERTFSLLVASLASVCRLTVMRSRAKSAGLVVVGHWKPREAK